MGEKKRDWKNTVIMLLIITSIILSILLLIVNMDIKEIIKKQPIAPEKGIVSYWSFDKNTIENNTIKDLRGQNNAKNFGADFTEKGRYYGAFNFDDNKDYIDCGNDPSLNIINNITISIWVKFSELTKNKEMINNNLFSLFHSSEESGNKIYFLYKVNIPKNAEKRYSCDSEIDSMTGVKTETEPRMNRWYN
ncbi:MAG: hypothetical protein KKA79_01210, partial [Nanoarchaeota archaeon]|nr:hypothetical protein [Nanoarchaeota archaeon]